MRAWHLAWSPLCVQCEARGLFTPADQVHHIVKFTSLSDPRRLDRGNLRSLCATCHAAHHGAERQTGVSHHGNGASAKLGQGTLLEPQDDWGMA